MTAELALLLALGWLVGGLVGLALLHSSGRGAIGFLLGAFLGPIGWIVAAIMRLDQRTPSTAGMMRCLDCAELVPREARKCRYCGRVFGQPPVAS